jgi:hypothetical protein
VLARLTACDLHAAEGQVRREAALRRGAEQHARHQRHAALAIVDRGDGKAFDIIGDVAEPCCEVLCGDEECRLLHGNAKCHFGKAALGIERQSKVQVVCAARRRDAACNPEAPAEDWVLVLPEHDALLQRDIFREPCFADVAATRAHRTIGFLVLFL